VVSCRFLACPAIPTTALIDTILFLLFWFVLLLILLLFLLAYASIPTFLLWLFFRTEGVPRALKNVVGIALAVLCAWGGYRYVDHRKDQDQAASHPHWPAVRLTVQQAGLLPYSLGRGSIEEARYDSVRRLVVSGDLPTGQRLQARFRTSPGFTSPNETNVVDVNLDKGQPIQAIGFSAYEPDSQKVSGHVQCVLPSGKQLLLSFPPTSVAVQ
jgi:hypothetical protein